MWVAERPTFAAPGSEGLYGIPGLPWPEAYEGTCEPLTAMAAAAGVTERVRIGSSALVPAPHHPAQLAAALATIDQISGGRVAAGIGSGWAHSDFDAVGVPFTDRNRLLDETFDVFEAVWGRTPWSTTPAALPVAMVARIWSQIREKATGYGRDASAMECVVRANIELNDQPIDGSVDQVVEDVVAKARLRADELFIDLSQTEPSRAPRG